MCPPSPLPRGNLPSVPFPCPHPQHPSVPPAKKCLAHALVIPRLPGERGTVLGVTAGDIPGVGRGGGAQLGTQTGCQTKGKAWLCPALAWSPPAPEGGFLYFISVMSCSQSLARLCTTQKCRLKTSPWLWFFSGLCPCVRSGVRGCMPPSCITSIAPRPGPAAGSSSVPVEQLWFSHPLAMLRLATAWCRNELSCSSRAREWLLKVGVQHHSGGPLGTRTTSSMGSLALLR